MKRTGFKQKARTPLKRGTSQMKRTPLRRVSPNKVKKQTQVGLWRGYGLEKPSKPRYKGLKGIYWYLLSKYTRQRDFKKYKGECIDMCGKFATDWHDFDAGHYISAGQGGFALLFDDRNVNGQLKACNNPTFSPNSQIGYREGIIKRYGVHILHELEEMYKDSHFRGKSTKEWTKIEYDLKIKELLKRL